MNTQLDERLDELLPASSRHARINELLAATPSHHAALIQTLEQIQRTSASLWEEHPRLVTMLARLCLMGDYPCRMLRQDEYLPSYIARYIQRQEIDFNAEHLIEELRLHVRLALEGAQGDVWRERLGEALRVFKRRCSLAVYLLEIQGLHSVSATTGAIAALAEACVDVALEQAALFMGDAALVEHVCVFGMGKLGGEELNYSSDIDLIFVCDEALARQSERHMLAMQVMREMVALLNDVTAHGYVFRVDLRLRPEGSQGALLPHATALINYYLSFGRTWERSAMLKARPIAGNRQLGERILTELEPFLFKKYLDFEAIDDIRKMKLMVNANAPKDSVHGSSKAHDRSKDSGERAEGEKRSSLIKNRARLGLSTKRTSASSNLQLRLMRARASNASATSVPSDLEPLQEPPESTNAVQGGAYGWNVKIGRGGIREIEFFVQALQLVHCGMRPALRVRGTLEALERLLYAGLVSHEDHAALSSAYDFYRRLEHRIQMAGDRQKHELPEDEAAMRLLAARMEMDFEDFCPCVERHRERVSAMFGRLFDESEQRSEKPTIKQAPSTNFERLVIEDLDEQEGIDLLDAASFERPRQVFGQLKVLKQKRYGPFSMAPDVVHRRGTGPRELGVYLLQTVASAPRREQAMSFLMRLISQVGDRSWFYEMLAENPHATRLLVHVFGSSELLAKILLLDPNVISRLLGAGSISVEMTRDEMQGELERMLVRVIDPDHRIGVMHRFQQEQFLRLGLHEVGGAASTPSTLEQLGVLAELTLLAVYQEVWQNLRAVLLRQGGEDATAFPQGLPERVEELPLCVLAMGKLGGMEPGFGSDLDILFVGEPDVQKGWSMELYSKLARRLVRALSSPGRQGRFYEVDTRLRPMGQQGTLVVSLEAFTQYHEESAGLWERQALCRARVIVGASQLAARLQGTCARLAMGRALPGDVREQMASMRQRMLDEFLSPHGVDRGFHIKKSRGGLIDLEFVVQYLQLCVTARRPELAASRAADATRTAWLDRGALSQNTLDALVAFARQESLEQELWAIASKDRQDFEQMAQDYELLRKIELRLQLGSTQRDALIPEERDARRELARLLGLHGQDAVAQLDHLLDQVRRRVRRVTDEVLMKEGGSP